MIVLHYLEEVSNGEADLDPDEDTIKLFDEDYYSDEDEVEDLNFCFHIIKPLSSYGL
jgi:hypothetical protein